MAKTLPLCPVCEAGQLRPSTYVGELKHNKQTLRVEGLECYVCDECGADPVFEDQIRRNHRRYQDARRKADGLLTGDEVRAVRSRLSLTQQQAAQLFGGGANAFSKYERDDVIQSVAMDRLMKASLKIRGLVDFLAAEAGIKISDLADADIAKSVSWRGRYAAESYEQSLSRRPTGDTVVYIANWQRDKTDDHPHEPDGTSPKRRAAR